MLARTLLPLALALAAGCAAGAPEGAPGKGKPSAAVEGLAWTHAELLAHLKGRGLDLETATTGGPAPTVLGKDRASGKAVTIILWKTPQDARELTGTLGELGYAWGRFCFVSPGRGGSIIPEIRKALE